MVPTKKSSNIFICENCDYYTSKKSQYDRHLATDKHKILQNPTLATNLSAKIPKYQCHCGKNYSHSSTLYAHKKQCNKNNSDGISTELVLELIKDNKEMKELLMVQSNAIQQQNSTINNLVHDVMKNVINNNSYNTNNSHNKAFNLNFFLNETCKEAINISDFVSSIKMDLDDLENTGRNGYIEGICNIILRNLNDLEQHERPIHCGDNKREILYIKDSDQWIKETGEKPILTKAIKVIANENIKQIKNWRDKNPDCTDSDSKKNNLYFITCEKLLVILSRRED